VLDILDNFLLLVDENVTLFAQKKIVTIATTRLNDSSLVKKNH
jgi:hypothetical protein